MAQVSLRRRTVLAGALAAATLAGPVAAAVPRVRYSVATPNGLAMLRKYARAVAMMNNPQIIAPQDTRSWLFQWYTHSPPNSRAGGPVTKAGELAWVYPDETDPRRALAEEVWSTCQPHFSGDWNLFLPWHRMYLAAFEDVIRSVLDDPTFTLPYWDYTAPGQRSLPLQFRRPGHATYGALYRPNRKKAQGININAGDPMDKGATVSPFNLDVLARPGYDGKTGFCHALDSGLHGAVHTGIGDKTDMGSIPTAANDPIFYLHHCNIDRLWAAWSGAGGQPAPMEGTFAFAGGNGDRVTMEVAGVLTTGQMNYGYDSLPPVPGHTAQPMMLMSPAPAPAPGGSPHPMALMAAMPARPRLLAQSTEPLALGGIASRVELEVPVQTMSAPLTMAPQGLLAASPAPPPPSVARKTYVVIEGLATDVEPGVFFEVFLNLPAGADPATRRARYIGTLQFFGASETMSSTDMPGMADLGPRATSFEVTEQVKLLEETMPGAPLTVSVIPLGVPADQANPTLAKISIIQN